MTHTQEECTLGDFFVSFAEKDRLDNPAANVVDGLFAIARSLDGVAVALHRLGTADAATPFGAMEALGMILKEGADGVAASLDTIATAIENHES